MGIIHLLDRRVSDQIAAGEVVERPASAVKELVENAMDAHAHNIAIDIENGGLDLIRVSDDGDGFYKDDLLLATKRHATSKIVQFNDIYELSTFGFRGEALASVAVISRMTIISGRNTSDPANVLQSVCGESNTLSLDAPRKGTIIEVRDLYFNVPARKKFVKSNSRENTLILDVITKFAIGSPEINFRLTIDGETRFSSNQLNTTEDVLIYAYGPSNDGIIHQEHKNFYQQMSVSIWFYPPAITHKNKNQMIYFVNDRLVESSELDRIISEAIYTLIPKGRFPICVIKLEISSFHVDVNVHPAKRFVSFNNIDEWKMPLITLLKEDLWLSRLNNSFSVIDSPEISAVPAETIPERSGTYFEQQPSAAIQRMSFVHELQDEIYGDGLSSQTTAHIMPSAAEGVEGGLAKYPEMAQNGYKMEVPSLDEQDANDIPIHETSKTELHKDGLRVNDLNDLTYIGQLNNSFLLAQDHDNLYIIDQHALHERILYERFMDKFDSHKIAVQTLLLPLEIHLTTLQEEQLVEHVVAFSQLGFTVERLGEGYYRLLSIPLLLSSHVEVCNLLKDILDDLSESRSDVSLAIINEEAIIMASCKAAVKAHYPLTQAEVASLFRQMSVLKNPHTCPHGRPIVMNISMNEIYLFFQRGSY